jgi:hypothetical protein
MPLAVCVIKTNACLTSYTKAESIIPKEKKMRKHTNILIVFFWFLPHFAALHYIINHQNNKKEIEKARSMWNFFILALTSRSFSNI